ncbi:SDR family NAD(P)-dependent oxidoreductase [Rubellimicrobium roseum]|uniref:SDR family oxidoreductase n=1 Tax=Rubellimicrobium roseum TaxID=687525 RepID=A0A5C4NHC0_9RHOB|nr:SDR family oxidoreductase [Rubellimicrobium roseum]TNC73265.1 SDR family oxidoreductase [Rubellimicrobium roseum]
MDRSLTGKIAFVTGSGRGLGRAMADKLASLGADVAIHDIDATRCQQYGEAQHIEEVAARIARHGGRVIHVLGNIGDPEAVAEMSRRITEELGTVDILVNCAGGDIGSKGGKPNPNNALDIALEDIQVETNNNLIGTFLVSQTFVRPMRDRGSGCVINIASAAAHMGCTPEVIYSTLKAAVVHYTRCLALEMRPHGVRVNAVSPGPTKTARFQATRKTDPAMMDTNDSLIRYADPEEIADAVAFLAGPQSRFIHGQVLRVDGGLTLFPG